jgi:hypothetical protein
MSFAELADDPPEGEVIDVAECPRGHTRVERNLRVRADVTSG